MLRRLISMIIPLALVLLTAGCGAEVSSEEGLCDEASQHMATCLGTDLAALSPASCTPEEARRILAEDCVSLQAKVLDQKSDAFDDFLARLGCRLGFFHLCEAQVCEPELDEPVHLLEEVIPEGASACLEAALAYEGCGACDYYACRDADARCGNEGYLMHFAHRYCNRYRLVSEPRVSPEAQVWLRKVRRCLITELDALDQGVDCQSIEAAGFASHATCYVETGFCELPVGDWIDVLNTIDPGDLRFRDMFVTGHACLSEWLADR